ncbi:MAG: hypothetical protein RLN72_04970 [Henriciella sp.]
MGSAALALLCFLVCLVLAVTILATLGVFVLGGIPTGASSVEYSRLGPGILLVFQLAIFWMCSRGVMAYWRRKMDEEGR